MPSSLRNQIILTGSVLIALSVILTGFITATIINDPFKGFDESFEIRSEILNELSTLVLKDGDWERADSLSIVLSEKFSVRIVLATDEGSVIVDTSPESQDESLVGIGLIDPANPLFKGSKEQSSPIALIAKLNKAMASCLKDAGISYVARRGVIQVVPVIENTGDIATSKECYFTSLKQEVGYPNSLTVYLGVDKGFNLQWVYLSLVGIFGFGLVTGFTLWFSRKIARPLNSLRFVAERIGEGDLTVRVKKAGLNEIDQLVTSFNGMVGQLNEVSGRRRKFMSDISHEIRSPLTNVRSHIEAVLDGVETFSDMTLQSIKSQVEQVTRLVEDLQQLSLADEGLLIIDKFPVVMDDIVEQIYRANKPNLDEAGISVDIQGTAPVPISIDPLRIRQVLQNLISNAIQHTARDGCIQMNLYQEEISVMVTVKNTGQGIPPEFLPHMFERFARDDQSRSRNTGGSGLGLSIALEITLAHNGSMVAENDENGEALFRLTLPS